MNYEELLNKGLIKRFKTSPAQMKNRMELVKRDITGVSGVLWGVFS